jgi:hypothetical protein
MSYIVILMSFTSIFPSIGYVLGHRIKISNRRATQRCNVSAFFYAKICSLLARRRSSQPVQRVYWPENVIDWLGKWRPTCVMRHARGQKLQSFRHKWALLYGPIFILCSRHVSNALYGICVGQSINSTTAIIVLSNARFMNKHFFSS